MTSKQRLDAVFERKKPDRTPVLGGWIACPEHIRTLAGVDEESFWAAPREVSIQAYRNLGSDGLINVFVPRHRSDFRCVDNDTYQHAESERTVEETVEYIDSLPEPERIEAEFDFVAEYERFAADLKKRQAGCEPMAWMPAQWSLAARVNWYGELGYVNFFNIVGAYPERARRLMEVGGARGVCRSRLLARAVSEGLYPKAVLFGEDICTQRGPMISPEFMEKYYAPQLARGLEPLLAVGCRPVWHSDGDIRAILDMLIDCGVEGFQGFQPECGMVLEEIVQRRTRAGAGLCVYRPRPLRPPLSDHALRAEPLTEAIDPVVGR